MKEKDDKQNKELRNIVNELLSLLRLKSKNYTSRKRRQQLLNEIIPKQIN